MYKITTYYQLHEDKVNAYEQAVARAWYDHVIYTRNTILALLAHSDDTNESLARLLKNQDDIGNLLRPFYPADQVDQIVKLLKDHINQAGVIVNSVLAHNDTTALVNEWRANCQAIIDALIAMDPYWVQTNLSSLWDEHLTLTLNEVGYRINKNWSSDILNFDNILDNIQKISTILANGIVEQFPLKFYAEVKKEE